MGPLIPGNPASMISSQRVTPIRSRAMVSSQPKSRQRLLANHRKNYALCRQRLSANMKNSYTLCRQRWAQ